MYTMMKNGAIASDPRLGRVYEQDLRSLNHLISQVPDRRSAVQRPRSYTWGLDLWLNQGSEGACVGFGFSHDLAARPAVVNGVTNEYARQAYFKIQMEDYWPGGAYPDADPFYEGTSVLTGAKVMTDLGYYQSYKWALNAQEIAAAIAYYGPCILGLNWYTGMFDTDANGFINPTGIVEGGHCIAAVGVKIVYKSIWKRWFSRTWADVDWDKSYIILHNSWGPQWGQNGRAKLRLSDLDKLMTEYGEACFPVRNSNISNIVEIGVRTQLTADEVSELDAICAYVWANDPSVQIVDTIDHPEDANAPHGINTPEEMEATNVKPESD